MKKEMKKVVCVLLSFMSCLLVSCDKDDDWDKNLGNNLLEGIWTRESSSQKFVATFNADHTSYVCTYHIETEALEHVDLQGKYRVVDESLLVCQSGDKHLFKLSEDGNTVEITYGYGTGNPEAEKNIHIQTLCGSAGTGAGTRRKGTPVGGRKCGKRNIG